MKAYMQSHKLYQILRDNAWLSFRINWNPREFQFTPIELDHMLILDDIFIGTHVHRTFIHELVHYLQNLYDSFLDMMILVLLWSQIDEEAFRATIPAKEMHTFQEIIKIEYPQDPQVMGLLKYLTPQRLELYRLGLTYLSLFSRE